MASLSTRGSFSYNPKSTFSILPGSMQKLPLEQDKQVKVRKETFAACWKAVEKEINSITASQHDRILDGLLHFISSSHTKLQSLHARVTNAAGDSHTSKFPPLPEVHTAVLIAGVNMSDHAVLFEQLREKVHVDVSPYVVSLKAKDCNSGMKATMQRILLQLRQWNIDQDSSSDEEVLRPLPAKRKVPRCSMRILCSWYEDTVESAATGTRPPVVIIIEDLEAFQPNIIQGLILSLSARQSDFPCVLVLCVATSVSVLHQLLPQHATSLLSIEQFHTQQSSHTMAHIIKKVLLTHHFPFKLGPKALNFLLHQFFYWNLSLADFTQGLKFAMLEHFDWQPLSPLCVGTPAPSLWTRGFFEAVRATPSMQRFIESLAPRKRLDLLENDSKLMGQVKALLGALEQYHQIFYPLLCCLHYLTRDLPDAPLGKQLHELYLFSLEQNIVEEARFKRAWELVNMQSKENFTKRVSQCVQELQQASSVSSGPVLQVMKDTLAVFETFHQESAEVEKADVSDTEPPASSSSPMSQIETTAERRRKFHERLRQIASRRPSGPTVFEIARNKLTEALLQVFTKHLRTPKHQPLHEAFYYDRVAFMQAHLAVAPRTVIQKGLGQPPYYLHGAEAGTNSDDVISPDQPDVCILYQLHLEHGKLINLYDLLQSFVAVVMPDDAASDEEDVGSKKKSVDPVVHARFIQAVNVLQLLGFIKPTQRKTDHVQRLTWGPL